MEGDLCMICHKREVEVDDYGIFVCKPCIKKDPRLQSFITLAANKDPLEWGK